MKRRNNKLTITEIEELDFKNDRLWVKANTEEGAEVVSNIALKGDLRKSVYEFVWDLINENKPNEVANGSSQG